MLILIHHINMPILIHQTQIAYLSTEVSKSRTWVMGVVSYVPFFSILSKVSKILPLNLSLSNTLFWISRWKQT